MTLHTGGTRLPVTHTLNPGRYSLPISSFTVCCSTCLSLQPASSCTAPLAARISAINLDTCYNRPSKNHRASINRQLIASYCCEQTDSGGELAQVLPAHSVCNPCTSAPGQIHPIVMAVIQGGGLPPGPLAPGLGLRI
jgi:hypothetical protein